MATVTMRERLQRAHGRNVELWRSNRDIPFVGMLEDCGDGTFQVSSGGRGRPAIVSPEDVTRVITISQERMEIRRKELQRQRLAQKASEVNGVPIADLLRLRQFLDDILDRAALADEDSES